MVALQDGQAPKAFAGSTKVIKNRKGLVVLPPEEVTTCILDNWPGLQYAKQAEILACNPAQLAAQSILVQLVNRQYLTTPSLCSCVPCASCRLV